MRRSCFYLSGLPFLFVVFVGCATVEERYTAIQRENTVSAYEKFLKDYPASPFTQAAKERLEDLKVENIFVDTEANNSISAYKDFIQEYPGSRFSEVARRRIAWPDEDSFKKTCQIGTIRAFQGFIESYPSSEYLPIVNAYVDYKKATASGTIESYQQFITQHPGNPFIVEAKATFLMQWLREVKGKVGIIIDVGSIVAWKGAFGGGKVTEDEVRQKVFTKLKGLLDNEGISCVLLETFHDVNKEGITYVLREILNDVNKEDISVIFMLHYDEIKGDHSGLNPSSRGGLHEHAVNNLANAFMDVLAGPPVNTLYWATITDSRTGWNYYKYVPDRGIKDLMSLLYSKLDGRSKILQALVLFGEKAVPPLTIALYENDCDVQYSAANALGMIGGDSAARVLVTALKDGEMPSNLKNNITEALGKARNKDIGKCYEGR